MGPEGWLSTWKRDYGIKLSVYGIYRVLVRAGEIQPRQGRPRKKPVYYQMNYPGQRGQVGGCKEKGIRHKLIPIATPKQNGKSLP
jgi:hypothetical protein